MSGHLKKFGFAASLCILAACSQSSPSESPPEQLAEAVTEGVIGIIAPRRQPRPGADLADIYAWLHANPELSLKEVNTSAMLGKELESLGFTVTRGLGDAWVQQKAMADQGEVRDDVGGYGVVGVLENGPGPVVLIRTDMDGLPVVEKTGLGYASTVTGETWTGVESGVMHACGHDIHMTSWIGTARQLVADKDNWSGTLVMIAQPAEEIGLGAVAMINDGLFERFPRPDYNLGLHVSASLPAGKVGYSSGYALANVDSVDIIVKGIGGHGAYPQGAKDPVMVGSAIVMALQTLVSRTVDPQNPAVVTVGSFQAGAKHNIIPDQATLLATVRSYDDDTRALLLDGIERIARAQAIAFGAPEPEIKIDPDYTPSTYNNPELVTTAMAAITDAIGVENVQVLKPVMAGEDFGQYGRTPEKIPSFIFWVGGVSPEAWMDKQDLPLPLPSLHSPFFAPDFEPAIETGTIAMNAAARALFDTPDNG